MPELLVTCHGCGRCAVHEDVVPRSACCDGCGSPSRCCLNCRFYEPGAHNDCRETSAERVVDKDRSNFCDYFSPSSAAGPGSAVSSVNPAAELEKLFGKK